MNSIPIRHIHPCPEGWGIEEVLVEAYREGVRYALPGNAAETPQTGELTDAQRLAMMLAMREVNARFDKRKQRIRDFGQVGLGIAGDLLHYSGAVALMRRGLELGLAEEGPEAELAIAGVHEILGHKLLSAFDSLDISAFQDILAVMKARQAGIDIREVKSNRKSKCGGRSLKAYNLDVSFPMALRRVVSRRSRFLALLEPGVEFTRRPIDWIELRDAICDTQREFGGEKIGIRFVDISARVKDCGFSDFMTAPPSDGKNWKSIR